MKDYIEKCAIQITDYIVENNATVRYIGKEISMNITHMVISKWNGMRW